ncbi:MAG: hypothetical protein IKR23_01650 [Lachnospiraceae bacterium]|nr:hypothetical protein [Lachnospiraceae bacterium]
MGFQRRKNIIKKAAFPAVMLAFSLPSCNMTFYKTDVTADDKTDITADDETDNTTDPTVEGWIDSVTDERGVYIGQEKEVVGYYKRVGIVEIGGTYDDILKYREIEKRGYLVAFDDGTAFFDLDGEKTEYVFDGGHFYLSDDRERANGFSYTCINGRLIINDGITITQYLRLTDEELASYLENN